MAFCAKLLSLSGLARSQRCVSVTKPFLVHVQETHGQPPRRQARPKQRKPKAVEVEEKLRPLDLYADELGRNIWEKRAENLPDKTIQDPFGKETRKCVLCRHSVTPDYKNVKLLSQFISPFTGKLYGRHITGLCKAQHEMVAREIDKSRSAGFMAYYFKHEEFLEDPKLFDPDRPMMPHPYF